MQTWQEQHDFFMAHWLALREALESGGAAAGVAHLDASFSDPLERRVMYVFANQGVLYGDWAGRDLDLYIALAGAGIAECLGQAAAAADEAQQQKLTNTANVISYNLGADLAFCWNDGYERTQAHYERGLQAGEDCIRWRQELGNPPSTLSMAYWLSGIHRLALKDFPGAVADFAEALRYSEEQAKQDGVPTDLEHSGSGIAFNHGMLALARLISGDESARAEYSRVRELFAAQLAGDDAELQEDAAIYVPQFEAIERRFGL